MKSGSSAGVKLWAPPSSVKFGCLGHDVQLSSSARRMCRMVRCSSIQIVTFALSVFLQMVAFVSWSMRMRVERRCNGSCPDKDRETADSLGTRLHVWSPTPRAAYARPRSTPGPRPHGSSPAGTSSTGTASAGGSAPRRAARCATPQRNRSHVNTH